MGCYAISTEISLPIREHLGENDAHSTIDLLGVSKKYIPYNQQKKQKVKYGDLEVEETIKWFNILRGIEIKVSRNDFNNGFIHSGCNYNYLLIPKRLVKPTEIHKDIGILEADLTKITVKKPRFATMQNQGFSLTGIQLTRRPKPKKIDDYFVNSCYNQIGASLTLQAKRWLIDELSETTEAT